MLGFKDIFNDLLGKITGLSNRVNRLETLEYIRFYPVNASAYLVQTTINAGVTYTSPDLRGVGGISTRAQGFLASLWIDPLDTDTTLQICSGNETPGAFSQTYKWLGLADSNRQLMSTLVFGFLDTNGTIKIKAVTSNTTIYVVLIGYWE